MLSDITCVQIAGVTDNREERRISIVVLDEVNGAKRLLRRIL